MMMCSEFATSFVKVITYEIRAVHGGGKGVICFARKTKQNVSAIHHDNLKQYSSVWFVSFKVL